MKSKNEKERLTGSYRYRQGFNDATQESKAAIEKLSLDNKRLRLSLCKICNETPPVTNAHIIAKEGLLKTLINMKTNELMIGNHVNFKGAPYEIVSIAKGGEVVIFSSTHSPIYSPHRKLDDLEPIPLTDHVLQCCGFNKNGIEMVMGTFSLFQSDNGYTAISVGLAHNAPPQVCYLHQLQNLYFILTNFELTINFLNWYTPVS